MTVEKWCSWYEAYTDETPCFYICKARFKKTPETLTRLQPETDEEVFVEKHLRYRTRFLIGDSRLYNSKEEATKALKEKLEHDIQSLQTELKLTSQVLGMVKCL